MLHGQQLNSVSLEHEAYRIINNAALRGIIDVPPAAKPWPEQMVVRLLREILAAPELRSPAERDLVSALIDQFNRKSGLDLSRGAYYQEHPLPGDSYYSLDAGLSWESHLNLGSKPFALGTTNVGTVYLDGDLGRYLSWDFTIRGGVFYIDRDYLGDRPNPPYLDPKGSVSVADGIVNPDDPKDPDRPPSPVYALPAYFPYSFSKPWEAAVFKPAALNSYDNWPDSIAFGYEIISEINTSLVQDRIQLRFGRMRRDWGTEETGTSLVLNSQARPFLALEGTVLPLDWMAFSFLTGVPEYQKDTNQWSDADPFQNLFSLAMLEFNIKRYVHFDFGSATVWPKRFDLGYLFPVNSNFFYQNNIGDFDNLALFATLEGRWPGIGKLWGSFYLDEANFLHDDFFSLDREMYALQGGLSVGIPRLPFGTLTLRYTKVEPYCYTHEYTETPWTRVLIDTAYVNNGESLGYYLPPNSDELLLRLESPFLPGARAYLQYQLIRHGVEYGYGRVDGSSLTDKIVKDDNTRKYFLRDGVYEWDNVIKAGGTYSLRGFKIPVSLYAEAGLVLTRFSEADVDYASGTTTDRGNGAYSFLAKDDAGYQSGLRFIFSLGFKVY
jgi:hypothetical protein